MAIAQAQTLNSLNANPLNALLQGTEAITSILNNAAAAARQRVDNQRSQDAALVQNMQLAQGMSQRRAQDLDQRLIDRRNFGYRVFQDSISNDLRERQFDEQNSSRQFNQGIARERLDLSRDASSRQQQALDFRQQQLQRQQDSLNAMGVVDPLIPTAENTPTPPEITPQGNVTPVARDPMSNFRNTDNILWAGITPTDDALNAPVQTPTAETAPQSPFANFSDAQLNARVDMYKNAEAANKKAGNPQQLNQNIQSRNQIEEEIARRKTAAKVDKPQTAADARAARFEQRGEAQRLNQIDLADTAAFPLPDAPAQKVLSKIMTDNPDLSEEQAIAKLDEVGRASLLEARSLTTPTARLTREQAAVQNYPDEEAFVAAGGEGLSDTAKNRRREFYRRNKGISSTAPQTTSSGFDSLLNAAGIRLTP